MNTGLSVILICAGEGERWGNYLGTTKHLIKAGGERLLDRAVRLVCRENPQARVSIVVKEISPDYEVPPAVQYKADLNSQNGDADKFLSSRFLWNTEGRTVVCYGDVWWTEDAIRKVMGWPGEDWVLFATREECLAQSFYPKDQEEHLRALHRLAELRSRGELKRNGGWEHFRAMAGYPLEEHIIGGPRFVGVTDHSTDFDTPEFYEEWLTKHGSNL